MRISTFMRNELSAPTCPFLVLAKGPSAFSGQDWQREYITIQNENLKPHHESTKIGNHEKGPIVL
jgi:hypothetical protein